MRPGSLTVVGTGLYAAGHVTPEALAHIESAEKLLHLVVDPVSRCWLQDLNSTAESLFDAYADGKPRRTSYDEMVARVLEPVRLGLVVCLALYGHPGVLVDPSHEAVAQARTEGHRARMLPAISSEDCLFADLLVDPALRGCQSFEATDFLIRKRRFDSRTPLVLWQIGAIGVTTFRDVELWSRGGLRILAEALAREYPPEHRVVVYEAACFAICEPSIQIVALRDLARARVSTSSTLYVAPRTSEAAEPVTLLPRSLSGEPQRRNGLSIVGTGYGVAGHVTLETLSRLERADRLFYLVTDPATSDWLATINPLAESLHDCYRIGESGMEAASRMVERILAPLREGMEVCAAFSGHPAIGLPPSHLSVRQARAEGHPARVLPAVSFEDCLVADLGVDPGHDGRLLYDARDFLERRPVVDTSSALVLVQIGAVGLSAYRDGNEPNREGLSRLANELRRVYSSDHKVIVYEIADFPMCDPVVERIRISDLSQAPATIRSTLYVPPLAHAATDPVIAERLAAATDEIPGVAQAKR